MNGSIAKIWSLSQIETLSQDKSHFVILDLGCGDGSPVNTLFRRNPRIRYFGVEPYKPSYEKACRLLQRIHHEWFADIRG